MKFCRGCKQEVAKTEFGKNKSQKDGLHWACKPCAKIAAKGSRERKKARKLVEAEACREEHLKTLTPKQRDMAEALREDQTTHSTIPLEPKSMELCQTYVRRLTQQKRWMGSGFPRMTNESLAVWEDRLKKLMTPEGYNAFLEEIGVDED